MPPSPLRAFAALVWFAVRRQARVRALAGVAVGLLAVLALAVGSTTVQRGWRLSDLTSRRFNVKVGELPVELLPVATAPVGPGHTAARTLHLGAFTAALADDAFQADWAVLGFTRAVEIGLFLGFVLPLFTLAFGTAAVGTERESRTLIWLVTRPLPRWAVYLAELLAALPWGLAAGVGGLAVLCASGGRVGLQVFALGWPAAAAGSVAFTSLFVLVGATVRRPAVVGLVYVFFFETLVASLPGSLKQLSLNYYVRSLLYNAAESRLTVVSPTGLDVYAPADPLTAGLTLAAAAGGFAAVGMGLFGRLEPTDET
jgi:hypothetical protein